ncbi:hypothetical protein [Rhizobium sp. AG855]|uniref:hypothetical protein n=1 Tax=Rhizobium sp. AG855 TaxID=2183898 RepID=UPI000FEDEFCA|nr:hypothetical protein [Rhizobium sp. AG855]RKE85758.1 hypothetical protein DFO46_2561 [Rhizobium sp. AG855]
MTQDLKSIRIRNSNSFREKIEQQSQSIDSIHKISELLFLSQQSFLNKITVIGSILTIIFGIGSISSSYMQWEKLNSAIEEIGKKSSDFEKKIDDELNKKAIKSISIRNTIDDSGYIYGSLSISPQFLGEKLVGYTLESDFSVIFSFVGSTTNHLNSYKIKYSKKFVDTFLKHPDQITAKEVILGKTYTLGSEKVVTGRDKYVSFNAITRNKSCEYLENEISKLVALDNAGEVTIWPIYEIDNQIDSNRTFIIKFEQSAMAYDCAHFETLR